jgi:cell division protein ZapA
MAKTIDVEIYGQRYTIKGEADADYMKQIARYVDDQMQTLARGMQTTTLSKLAVLTALNIAHQLFQAEQRLKSGEAEIERRTLTLMDSIEQQLDSVKSR